MRLSALPAAIVVASCSAAVPASALDRHNIQGIWRHPDNGSLIRIYPCDGSICAKVVSTTDPNLKDIKNPDPALRDRPVVGIVLWQNHKESGDLQWIGTSYNTVDGGTYYGTLHLTGETTLAVSRCNLSVMLCADQIWTKAASETPKAVPTQVSKPKTAPAAPPTQVFQPKKAPVAPKTVAEKPKQPPIKIAETPNNPPEIAKEKPKWGPESTPRKAWGYE